MFGVAQNLPVAEDLKGFIKDEERNLRAIKIGIDKKRNRFHVENESQHTMASGDAFDEDFDKIDFANWLKDGEAAIVLIRTRDSKGVIEGAKKNTFLFLMWMPEGVPVRQKASWASSLTSLKEALEDFTFKEWNVSEREEITLKDAISTGRELTDAEVLDTMTWAERAAAEHELESQQVWKEYQRSKKRIAQLLGTFEQSLVEVKNDVGKAVLGKLAGFPDDDTVELGGEVLTGIEEESDLQGKCPQDDVAFLVLKLGVASLFLIRWSPESAPEDRKIKAASIVESLTAAVQERAQGFSVAVYEAGSDAMLADVLSQAA